MTQPTVNPGSSTRILLAWLLIWTAVWAFWLPLTHRFHPSWTLALIVTSALVTAYATAAWLNQYLLLPRLAHSRRWGRFALELGLVMTSLTACALLLIRIAYFSLAGPDSDPLGTPKHFLIDLFGMAVHLVAAWVVNSALSIRLRSADEETDNPA